MYRNIEVNHTNIKEYLKIAEERMLNDDATEEDIEWYFELYDKDLVYFSSDIGSHLIESEISRKRLEEASKKCEESFKKAEKVLNILDSYVKELPDIIKQNHDNK